MRTVEFPTPMPLWEHEPKTRTVAYARVSTDKQDVENQLFEIRRYLLDEGRSYDDHRVETVSGTLPVTDRLLGSLIAELQPGDTLIVSELSRISRKLFEVFQTIQMCLEREVTVIAVKQSFKFGNNIESKVLAFAFGLAAEIERDLISSRTKEALARRRAEGVVLGRPVGSHKPENLKLYGQDEQILTWMDGKVSKAAMARMLDVSVQTLSRYIDRQNLSQEHRWRQFKKADV